MKLLVHELNNNVYQALTPSRNIIVEAIRPHLYKHNLPSGNVLVEVLNQAGDVIASSSEVAITDLSGSDFFHGFIKFEINAYLKKDTTYLINIKAKDGYSFSESAYLGVCNSFDFQNYSANYTPNADFNSPLDVQIWERRTNR